jgi:purine-binding chemotaxis protein CheW
MKSTRHRSDPQKTLVGFLVGDVHYAIDIVRVVQIVNPLEMTVLPHLPDGLAGVAEHRGEVVPIVLLRRRFGLPEVPPTRKTKWVLVDVGGRPAALVVDEITDVFGTAGAELRPAPPLGSGDDQRGLLGVTSHDGRLTFVLDVLRLRGLIESFSPSMVPGGSGHASRLSLGPRG